MSALRTIQTKAAGELAARARRSNQAAWRYIRIALTVFGTLSAAAVTLISLPLAAVLILIIIAAGSLALIMFAPFTAQLATSSDEPTSYKLEELQDAHWRLSETAERYRDLLDRQDDLIVRRDASGDIVFANRAFTKLFGFDNEVSIPRRFVPTVIESDDEARSDTISANVTLECIQTVGGPRWISWSEDKIAARDGTELGTQIVGHDVTEQRLTAMALRDARDEAEAANRAKSRFLAGMSHEIRTPMNGILGMSALLADTPLSPEQQTYVDAVSTSARTLLAIVDDILDFSKIEAGKLVLQNRQFSLYECVQSAVELLAPRAAEKGIELVWSVEADVPALVTGDETRLRQIVLNLLSNAVKFTDRGGVRVIVKRDYGCVSELPAVMPLVIAVQDTGIGLSKADAAKLFIEFEQAGDGAHRRGGTGLGLAISERLARAMGGRIVVQSEWGKGSTFAAHIVVQSTQSVVQNRFGAEMPRHVLLAFDGPLQRRALAETIENAGGLTTATDIARGMDAISSASPAIEAVIVECSSDPVTCGELLEAARSKSDEPGNVIGIVLIPATGRAALTPFRAQGFERYLVMPVRPKSLLEQLDIGLVAGAPAVSSHSAASEPKASAHLPAGHALVAEDNEINALLTKKVLERLGWTYHVVSNGRSAIEAVAATLDGHEQPYDLILMDVFMPEIDGFAATKAIKEAFVLAGHAPDTPPIVALTANAFADDRLRCLEAGMDDYLAKPFAAEDLAGLITKLCGGCSRLSGHRTLPPAA